MRSSRAVASLCVLGVGVVCGHAGAQDEYGPIRGTAPVNHVGVSVLGVARLVTTAADSAALVVCGSGSVFVVEPGGLVRVLPRPVEADEAFGSAGTVIRSLAAPGFDAFAVGDPSYGQARGKVWVYLGNEDFAYTPTLTLEGEAPGDLFGAAVAGIGDVNGDGFGDLAVGAPGKASGTGQLLVFLGGSSPATTPAMTANGGAAGDLLGSPIAPAGDLNSDGFADFVGGTPGELGGQGAVWVFRGGTTLASSPQQILPYPGGVPAYGSRPRFGAALAGGRDLTGDGVPDLLVGAPGVGRERGSIFAFAGAAGGLDPAPQELSGVSAYDRFGSSLSVDGFIGDGSTNLAIGAPGAASGKGAVSLFATIAGPPIATLQGQALDDGFGVSLGSGRLFVRTPVPQLVIGAPFSDLAASNGGAVFMHAWPPAVAVEQTTLTIESDGIPLQPNDYTSTNPRLILRLGSGSVDVVTADVTIDGVKQSVHALPEAQALRSSAGVEVPVAELTEGPHELRAQLHDMAHAVVGTAHITFVAAARLRIESAQITPNPVSNTADLVFTLTRPANFQFLLFDVSGRKVFRQEAAGQPAENKVRLAWQANRPAPGIYFYVLDAAYQQQRSTARGRLVLMR